MAFAPPTNRKEHTMFGSNAISEGFKDAAAVSQFFNNDQLHHAAAGAMKTGVGYSARGNEYSPADEDYSILIVTGSVARQLRDHLDSLAALARTLS